MKKKFLSLLMVTMVFMTGTMSVYAQIPNDDIQDIKEQPTPDFLSEVDESVSDNEISDIEETDLYGDDVLSMMSVSENDSVELQMVEQNVAAGHSFGAATSIKVNTNVSDRINDNYEKNYYKFTLSASGAITISFSHELFESAAECWEISLYSSSQECFTSFYSSDGYNKSINSRQIGLPAGTYYICVKNNNYTNNVKTNYTLKAIYTKSDNWEKEFNDGWLTATTVQTNQIFYGSNYGSDEDYYKFTLPKAGVVQINFSHPIFASGARYWEIGLYDANHDNIMTFSSTDGYTASRNSRQIGLPIGTYYLLIENRTYTSGYAESTYTFHINYKIADNWEKEFNDDWLTATTVQTNQIFYGSNYGSDEDYYKFTLPKAGVVQINFSHPIFASGARYWEIGLYDATHDNIEFFYSTDGYTSTKKSELLPLSSGIYYLLIKNNTYNSDYAESTYNFSINTQPTLGITEQTGDTTYMVTKSGTSSEVALVSIANKNVKSIIIPDTVEINGFSFKVTAIQSGAFKDCKNLTSVTIGRSIKKIGSKAFYGCKKLKKITVKSTVLKSIGKKAFKGIHKKAVIKVPKSKLAAYRKLMKKKGQAESVKIKK